MKLVFTNILPIFFLAIEINSKNIFLTLISTAIFQTYPDFIRYSLIVLLHILKSKDEISELRDFFERSYMILTCQRCTKEDIEKARLILDKMKQATNKGSFDEYIQYDIPFHRSLCEFSKNQYFILVFRLMEKAITEHLKDNTIAFSKLPSFSLNKKDDNFYLKQLVIGHQNYIVALEKHDSSIAMQYLHPYLDIYKTNRHKTENNNF